ncbi:MAG TPA: PepSY-like domain-containing protein [Verrucomicrobiae bacterium]|nr:PepSY-like domain-containing protein [Verrucomicrobiae bacterium]
MKKYAITLLAASALLAGCNQSVETASNKFNELPPAVQKTVRAQAPNGDIANVTTKSENGSQVYEVEFRNPNGPNSKVLVAADGTLVGSDMTKPAGAVQKLLTPTGAVGTPLSALPEAAQKTIKSQAPDAPIAKISRHDVNGRTIYEVEFKDQGKNPTIKVADDGSLVQSLQK